MDNTDAPSQPSGPGKVLRAPNLKRGRNDEVSLSERVQLERVLGLTVGGNAALACSPPSELVAYPAGCTVVLLHCRKGRQSHLLNTSRKTVTSVAFSVEGRYLATGECGHQPSVRVWDLQAGDNAPPVTIAEFTGHKYGVSCVAFSPNQKHVVSVGTQHDMIVNVWDWRAGIKIASNKVSTKVKAVSFAENGSYFVTVGNRHVKFWYLEHSRSSKYKEPVPLMGRSAILGEQRNNYFCDVGCGRGEMGDSTYAITKSGLLCEFNNRRLLDKWVELRTTSANCLAVGERYIVIGCAEGIVRCFDPNTLHFVTTLPRTHYLGVDVAQGLNIQHMAATPSQAKYPDVVAITLDEEHCKVTCVYNDHSLYVWDVRDIRRVGKSQSFLYHSACIWGVEMYPELPANLQPAFPPGSFLTCSSDDTIRVWNFDNSLPLDSPYERNIYSNELLKVIYVDLELNYLKDLDVSGTTEKPDSSYDGRNGVRAIRVNPDGRHLASGDRAGNIRIHDLLSVEEVCRIEAHDAEVLCLEYSQPESGHRLLASASRDRLIHIFNVDQDYNFMQTLDDHSSSITSVRFLQQLGQLGMASCGADKSIIFRQLQPGSPPQFARGHNVAGKTTLYDMEVDAGQKHVLTACQDRNIRVYNVGSGKHSKTFKGSASDEGSLIKVVLDSSGIYLATSCTDKTLSVYDYYSGECLATMLGHSELVTGLRFTTDGKRLISASGDGCLFVWKLPHDMVVTMQARRSQQAARTKRPAPLMNGQHDDMDSLSGSPTASLSRHDLIEHDYRFSVGQLPLWAKKQIDQSSGPNLPTRQMDMPKGRWAQRLDAGGITVKSVYDSDSIIPFPSLQGGMRGESDGSKDSSMDSGGDIARTRMMEGEDGDIEDYSEGEGESTEPEQAERLVYYPPVDDTGSDYTVNAMDVEELRRSQRRHKKTRPERPSDLPSIAVSGSQDSDDDDEASTPSADTAERNLLSMLSVSSSESLDRVGQREQFLKNNFESLSGAEQNGNEEGGTSISSQFLTRSGVAPRNVALITAARQTQQNAESLRRREELQRRIEDTRRKLQSVGYRSNLSSSQSITDLSHIPEKDFNSSPLRLQGTDQPPPTTAYYPNNSSPPPPNCATIMAWATHNTNKRPNSISLRATNNTTHQSLPESPVYETPPPKACSFYIDLNIPKSESTPALVTKLSAPKHDSDDEGGTFSSDSLEKEEVKPPRRCISDYQIKKESMHWVIPLPSSTPATPRPKIPKKPPDLSTRHRVVSRSRSLQDTRNSLSRPPTPGLKENGNQLQTWEDEGYNLYSTSSTPASNSPKRMIRHPLTRRVSLRQNLLPSKCSSGSQAGYRGALHEADDSPGSGGLRRAISLSDLSGPAPPRRPNNLHVSGKVQNRQGGMSGTRTLPRPGHKNLPVPNSGMSRSSSVGVLNQAEEDPLRSRPLAARHTISSQNKMAANQAARRRSTAAALSASAGNLLPGAEDSSSEEAPAQQSSGKPAIAPRPRNIPTSNGPVAPPRGMGRTAREVTQRLAGGKKPAALPPRSNMEVSPQELPVKDTDVDITTAPITPELCQKVIEGLIHSADNLATLYKRISMEIEPSEQRTSSLQALGASAIQGQRTLRMVAPGTASMNEAPQSGDMVHMMQQYSDMLVSIVQQRMAKPPSS